MRVADLREIVESARVDPTYYSFDGERHETLAFYLPARLGRCS